MSYAVIELTKSYNSNINTLFRRANGSLSWNPSTTWILRPWTLSCSASVWNMLPLQDVQLLIEVKIPTF